MTEEQNVEQATTTKTLSLASLKAPKTLTYGDLITIARGQISSVVEGFNCPLEMLVRYRAFMLYAEEVQKGIEYEALREFERHCEGGRNEIDWGDIFSIAKTTTGSKWDYSQDPIWLSLTGEIADIEKQLIEPLKKALKEREAFLRQIANNPRYEAAERVNERTGEVFIERPAVQIAGKETLRFTPKK
jgi:hypothetical protein